MATLDSLGDLPELVRDSKLHADFRSDGQTHYTIHKRAASHRVRQNHDVWIDRGNLGVGGQGSVELQVKAPQAGAPQYRAVKSMRIPARELMANRDLYIRELEAIFKFSQARHSDLFVKADGWFTRKTGGPNLADSHLYISMEYFPSGDLQNYLRNSEKCPHGRLPEDEGREIACQILEALSRMHEEGFAHRDLKPANVLIQSHPPDPWWVKLGDFGLSKRSGDATESTAVQGTRSFMPPELLGFHGDPRKANPYSIDVWCLGETIFRTLVGKPTFETQAALGRYYDGRIAFPLLDLRDLGTTEDAITFLHALLLPNPKDRLTTRDAVHHSWLAAHDEPPQDAYDFGYLGDVMDGSKSLPTLLSQQETAAKTPASHSDILPFPNLARNIAKDTVNDAEHKFTPLENNELSSWSQDGEGVGQWTSVVAPRRLPVAVPDQATPPLAGIDESTARAPVNRIKPRGRSHGEDDIEPPEDIFVSSSKAMTENDAPTGLTSVYRIRPRGRSHGEDDIKPPMDISRPTPEAIAVQPYSRTTAAEDATPIAKNHFNLLINKLLGNPVVQSNAQTESVAPTTTTDPLGEGTRVPSPTALPRTYPASRLSVSTATSVPASPADPRSVSPLSHRSVSPVSHPSLSPSSQRSAYSEDLWMAMTSPGGYKPYRPGVFSGEEDPEASDPDRPSEPQRLEQLANDFFNRQDYDQAEIFFCRLIKHSEDAVGRSHPETIVHLQSLADTLYAVGRLEEAKKLYQETLEATTAIFGGSHKDTLRNLQNLATVLYELQQYHEAEQFYREAAVKRQRLLGETNRQTLNSMFDLGDALFMQAKYTEAVEMYEEVVKWRTKRLGSHNRNTITATRSLARALSKANNEVRAAEYYTEVLSARRAILGPMHPDLLEDMRELEACLGRQPPTVSITQELKLANLRAEIYAMTSEKKDTSTWFPPFEERRSNRPRGGSVEGSEASDCSNRATFSGLTRQRPRYEPFQRVGRDPTPPPLKKKKGIFRSLFGQRS